MPDVAIVTGGSRGIGRACCAKLADLGYAVVVNYARNEAEAESIVGEIKGNGGIAVAVRGDVSLESDIEGLFAAADRLGRLRLLVNNAGVVDVTTRVDAVSRQRLDRLFAINVIGSILCAREAVRRLSTRHGGSGGAIINVSSIASVLGGAGQYVDYAATKGAIDTFTVGLAREVAEEGIRVNAVRPGTIDTEIHASGGNPGRAQAVAPRIPMKRPGLADEIAETIVWLASERASYVTGAVLDVSGGL
ncbi:MAG TPA: SDR family oxidoreductase [Hyphomicrobiaceae bacterium]|nr:SDR family oxidoreductase [Hyphomicrobiaceae bacterium]